MNTLKRIFETACAEGIVIPAFNISYLPMVKAVCEGFAETDAFGLVEVARPNIEKFEAKSCAAVADEYRRFADRRLVGLHLDHVPAIDEDMKPVDWRALIKDGLRCGCGSVMIDGSRLPLEENIAVTAEVVRLAHAEDVLVEAELGSVFGHESGPLPSYEEIFGNKLGFTKPGEAREFVTRTGVDLLSVSVGSVHGAISGAARNKDKVAARIDIPHLRRLREAAGVPLVLHGGSGVQREYVLEAIKHGITKINIDTDIRHVYERVIRETADGEAARTAVKKKVIEIIDGFYDLRNSASRIYSSLR